MPIYVNSVGRVKSSTELPVIKLVPCCSNLLLLVLAIVMGLFIVLVCARSLLVLVVCSRHRTYACGMSKSSLDTVCSYCKLEFRQTSVRKFIRHNKEYSCWRTSKPVCIWEWSNFTKQWSWKGSCEYLNDTNPICVSLLCHYFSSSPLSKIHNRDMPIGNNWDQHFLGVRFTTWMQISF